MRQFFQRLAALLCLWAITVGAAHAQVVASTDRSLEQGGITVSGNGETNSRPNVIEIQLRSSARAELTGDAIVKYRDAKRRTLSAFEELKLPNVSVVEQGLSIAPGSSAEMMQNMMRGMPNTDVKPQIELSSTLTVRVTDIRDLTTEQLTELVGKLLDVAQDSGTHLGPSSEEAQMAYRYGRQMQSSFVRFVLEDIDAVREQTYQKAVDDARTRAERLARLNNVKVGSVAAVQEMMVTGDDARTVTQPWEVQTNATVPKQKVSSDSLADIPFRVKLLVRFNIAPPDPQAAKK